MIKYLISQIMNLMKRKLKLTIGKWVQILHRVIEKKNGRLFINRFDTYIQLKHVLQ